MGAGNRGGRSVCQNRGAGDGCTTIVADDDHHHRRSRRLLHYHHRAAAQGDAHRPTTPWPPAATNASRCAASRYDDRGGNHDGSRSERRQWRRRRRRRHKECRRAAAVVVVGLASRLRRALDRGSARLAHAARPALPRRSGPSGAAARCARDARRAKRGRSFRFRLRWCWHWHRYWWCQLVRNHHVQRAPRADSQAGLRPGQPLHAPAGAGAAARPAGRWTAAAARQRLVRRFRHGWSQQAAGRRGQAIQPARFHLSLPLPCRRIRCLGTILCCSSEATLGTQRSRQCVVLTRGL